MSDNMNEKYQQYHNKILVGTLNDVMLKSISYQANIQLANEIIAEQEKTILELQSSSDSSKTQLDDTIKGHLATISKLQADLYEANKLRTEYENVKHQVQHIDTYRNEVVKANDKIKSLENEKIDLTRKFEQKIETLKSEIESLKTPVPVKKTKAKKQPVSTPKAKIIKQDLPNLIVKDGGSF